jgi:hypothetical protein
MPQEPHQTTGLRAEWIDHLGRLAAGAGRLTQARRDGVRASLFAVWSIATALQISADASTTPAPQWVDALLVFAALTLGTYALGLREASR